jgi:hypothetical protein
MQNSQADAGEIAAKSFRAPQPNIPPLALMTFRFGERIFWIAPERCQGLTKIVIRVSIESRRFPS